MMGRRSLVAVSMTLALLGCDRVKGLIGKQAPKSFHYAVLLPDAAKGAVLVVDGEPAGQVGPGVSRSYGKHVGARVTLTSEKTLADAGVSIALRFPSPCGSKDVEVKAYKVASDVVACPSCGDKPAQYMTSEEERMHRKRSTESDPMTVQVWLNDGLAVPRATTIWVDDDGAKQSKIVLGKAEITERVRVEQGNDRVETGRRKRLWDLGCAQTHEVTVDGKVLATLGDDEKPGGSFLITTREDACYRGTEISYASKAAKPLAGERRWTLRGGKVFAFGWSDVDYFLAPAPSNLSIPGANLETRTELVRVDCSKLDAEDGAKK